MSNNSPNDIIFQSSWAKALSSSFPIVICDKESKVGLKNQLAENIYSEIKINNFLIDYIKEDGKEIWSEILSEVKDDYPNYRRIIPFVLNEIASIETRCLQIDLFNNKYYAIILCKDLTEEKLSKDFVTTYFLNNLSHELKTPLNAIMNTIGELHGTLSTFQYNPFLTLESSSHKLLKVVNSVLDYTSINNQQLQNPKIPFNIIQLIEQSLDIIDKKAANKDIIITLDVKDEINQGHIGDPARIGQTILTLVDNSLNHSNAESEIIINTKTETTGNKCLLTISVIDNGSGIDDLDKSKIFSPFPKILKDNQFEKGLGLGLAICNKIITSMGGTISFSSIPNEETVFSFTVPLEVTDINNVPLVLVDQKDNVTPKLQPTLKILIAEDNLINQKICQVMLKKMNYNADIANNGAEALKAVQKEKYDLILMDMQMPIMDGVEATIKIRELEKNKLHNVKIVALTANDLPGDKDRCIEAGMDDFISKPINAANLNNVLRQCTNKNDRDKYRLEIPFYIYEQELQNQKEDVDFKVLDIKTVLSNFEGDEDILVELIKDYLEQYPQLLKNIEQSLKEENSEMLLIHAQSFKGATCNFHSDAIKNTTLALEKMGQAELLKESDKTFLNLKRTSEKLKAELKQLLQSLDI